jgi:superfamily II DNA or RNA helicase
VIVPGLTLLDQMQGVLSNYLKEHVDVEQGINRALISPFIRSRVILASRDTLLSRNRFEGMAFEGVTSVVVDECHHGMTPRFERVLRHYEDRGAYVFGLSATPYKGKGKALRYWDRPCYVYSLLSGIEDAYLIRPVAHLHEMSAIDMGWVDDVRHEWDEGMLDKVLCAEHAVQEIAGMVVETYRRESSVVYCRDVNQAKLLMDVLARYAVKVCLVHSKQKLAERVANMDAFRSGEAKVIVNVDVLSFGWDHPELRRVYMAAPTRSLSRYEQRIGRSTRVLPGVIDPDMNRDERAAAIAASTKPVAHIHDITDTSRTTQILNCLDVLDAKVRQSRERRNSMMDSATEGGIDVLAATAEHDALEAERLRQEMEAIKEKRRSLIVGVTFDSEDRDVFAAPQEVKPKRGWRMLYGQYKGQLLRELPSGYLDSVVRKAKRPTPLVEAVKKELHHRKANRAEAVE